MAQRCREIQMQRNPALGWNLKSRAPPRPKSHRKVMAAGTSHGVLTCCLPCKSGPWSWNLLCASVSSSGMRMNTHRVADSERQRVKAGVGVSSVFRAVRRGRQKIHIIRLFYNFAQHASAPVWLKHFSFQEGVIYECTW